jgi:hypothetical protein
LSGWRRASDEQAVLLVRRIARHLDAGPGIHHVRERRPLISILSASAIRSSLTRSLARLAAAPVIPVAVTLLMAVQGSAAFAEATGNPPVVWLAPSMHRIGRDDPPRNERSLQLYAARGEHESFQVAISAPGTGLDDVTVEI